MAEGTYYLAGLNLERMAAFRFRSPSIDKRLVEETMKCLTQQMRHHPAALPARCPARAGQSRSLRRDPVHVVTKNCTYWIQIIRSDSEVHIREVANFVQTARKAGSILNSVFFLKVFILAN